jgi:hypothetical protein
MEAVVLLGGVLFLTLSALLYVYLIETKRIEPHTSRHHRLMQEKKIQRGNFWDAETQMFYKWDELMKLKNKKEKEKDDT